MSTWLQKQLVAFGKRLWTDREPIDRDKIVVPFPKIPTTSSKEREEEINTLSELSSITLLEEQVRNTFANSKKYRVLSRFRF